MADTTELEGVPSSPGVHPRVFNPTGIDNPYVVQLESHELYGQYPAECLDMLDQLPTVDPQEQLITAIRVRRMPAESGFLLLTTHWVRFIKKGRMFTVRDDDDFWSHDLDGEVTGFLAKADNAIRTPSLVYPIARGEFGLKRKTAKKFRDITRLAMLAVQHNVRQENDVILGAAASAAAGAAATTQAGVAEEIEKLSALRNAGTLTEEEFQTAKARVLEG